MLGPVRFTHIEACTREVCVAFKRYEQVEECIAQLDDLDITLTDLRSQIAAASPTATATAVKAAPDYSTMLDPPDLDKAMRLVKARESAIKGLRAILTKKKAE